MLQQLLQDILEESSLELEVWFVHTANQFLKLLKHSEIIEVEYYDVYNITFDYSDLKDIEREIRNSKLTIIQKDFGEKISYDLVSKNNRNIKEIFEKFHNKIKVNFKNKQVLKR